MPNKNNFIDVSFLVASSSKKSYQKLSESYSAIEPPTWALLLAQSCRSIGYKVNILDANAENLSNDQILEKINMLKPRMLVLVVYGQNVNAGTANMRGAIDVANFLKENKVKFPITFIGSHVQALPFETSANLFSNILASPANTRGGYFAILNNTSLSSSSS